MFCRVAIESLEPQSARSGAILPTLAGSWQGYRICIHNKYAIPVPHVSPSSYHAHNLSYSCALTITGNSNATAPAREGKHPDSCFKLRRPGFIVAYSDADNKVWKGADDRLLITRDRTRISLATRNNPGQGPRVVHPYLARSLEACGCDDSDHTQH
ncbi:hypothetical protein OH76DRAFT_1394821 [Lentinus brumalis]|uniref:Uncharacterized protein n=1 Tax=Lentinus brumalis TaxID=2498619 RepID=A0A371DWZ1_9APHY|nr:hypothetical protein OH76DRAFT_1394821 [Polyporus brumalis]